MLLSAFSFSATQIIIKILDEIPLMEKVLFKNLIVSCIIIKHKNLTLFIKKENRKYLLFRSLFGYFEVVLFFFCYNKNACS
jgi:drug/metabolite transporter (DMT)-like permease